MLAHVFETAGLSTVVFASIRNLVERIKPPRSLYCEFPLGRPLGDPNDPAFQTRTLMAGFELLKEPAGPVLVDYPERARTAVTEAVSCPLPPRYDPDLPKSIDEMRGLRPAFERAAENGTGLYVNFDLLEPGLAALERIEAGTPWTEADLPAPLHEVTLSIRNYYDQAALALADHIPGARSSETWFAQQTQTGELIHKTQKIIRASGAEEMHWFYMLPPNQHRIPRL